MEKVKMMSSYMVYRELFKNNRKDHYEILSVFIEYLINNKRIDNIFTDIKVKDLLFDEFGFDIPISAIKISLGRLSKKNIIKKISKSEYQVISVTNVQDEIFDKNTHEVKNIIARIKRETNSNLTDDEIVQELYSILIDDEIKNQIDSKVLIYLYTNKHDKQLQRVLSEFKEGFLLSTGVTYNIISQGYIKDELKVFLSTEILFFLMGYSGDYKNKMAKDFIKNLKDIDKDNKIKLKYFSDTKKEIERFFSIAQEIFMGKRQMDPTKDIVRSILQDIKSIDEITIKQSDLFYDLNKYYGITEDNYEMYYSKENNKYNLEGIELNVEGYAGDIEQSQIFISNINKLRQSAVKDIFSARAVYVTNKGITLKVEELLRNNVDVDEDIYVFPRCLSLSNITNIFWCSNPKTLWTCKPYNVDVVANISLALQNVIGFKAEEEYENIKKEFEVDNDEDKYRQRLLLLNDIASMSTTLSEDTNNEKVIFTIENLNQSTDLFFKEMEELRLENKELKRIIAENQSTNNNERVAEIIDDRYEKMKCEKREEFIQFIKKIALKIWSIVKEHLIVIIIAIILVTIYYLYKKEIISPEVFDFISFIK